MSELNINKLFKNFIICGEIDFYCLLCPEILDSLQKVNQHVRLKQHKKSVRQQLRDGREFIHKIRNNLVYCKPCNEVITELQIHRESSSHIAAKSYAKVPKYDAIKFPIMRHPNGTVVISNIIKLTDLQWHGIYDDFCGICLKDVRHGPWKHIILEDHIINLIQTSIIKFQHNYYRLVGHSKFFCFVCFNTYDIRTIEDHKLRICKRKDDSSRKQYSYLRKIIKDDPNLKKLFIIVDETRNKVQCLTCKSLVDGSSKDMIEHKNFHPSILNNVMDHGKRRHELALYGKQNHIKLNRMGNWCYCTLCHRVFSASIHQAVDHVHGEIHKRFLQLQGFTKPTEPKSGVKLSKIRFEVYLNQVYKLYDDFYIQKFQRQFSYTSFMLLSPYGFDDRKYFCFACNEIIQKNDMKGHCKTSMHLDNILACYVILNKTSYKPEFIRMIRPDLYHCAVCNLTFPYFNTIYHHLKGLKHIMNKRITVKDQPKAPKMSNKVQGFTFHSDVKKHLIRLELVSPDQNLESTSTA